MNSPRDLLKGLLEYIEEQAKSIDPKSYCVSAAKGFIRRNTELSGLPGLEFDIRPEGDHIWLHLERLEAHFPPVVPDQYKGLFKISSDPFGSVSILDESNLAAWIGQHDSKFDSEMTMIQNIDLRQEQLKQKAQIALQEYMTYWNAWAEEERPRRKSISLYGDLFSLKHQIEAEETIKPQELVWGIGIASWQIPFGETIIDFEYPILTQAVEISIDEKSMALEVRPRATNTRVEMEAFIACSILGAADIELAIKEQLQRHKDHPVTPFDSSSYTDVLKLAASNLDSNGVYREIQTKGDPTPIPDKDLVVTDTWVLLSRPRTNNHLTDDLKRLKEKLTSGCDIPEGPLTLVTPPSDKPIEFGAIHFRGLSSRGSSHEKVQELYFPLPYNEEQITIIQRLEKASGVTVQGPPGTGKTHTIANVICHYLATGRRVLVTSRGEPALKVLQSKIPEEIRALTVSLMASDREGIRQFQASIEAIQHQVSQLNPEQTQNSIAILEGAIDRAHHELSSIDTRIDEIAITQLSEAEVDGIPMRAQKLADLVISGLEQYGWFDDNISLSFENAPPLSEEEASKLRDARRKVGKELLYLQANLPSANSLPTTAAIAKLHDVLSSMRAIETEIEKGDLLDLKATTIEVFTEARELLEQVEEAKSLIEELELFDDVWPLDLRAKCRQSSFASERQALESLFADIDELIEARAEFLKRPIEFPNEGFNTIKTREAIVRAVETGKPFGFFTFGVNNAKEHIEAIRISGLKPTSTADWTHVHRYITLSDLVASFVIRWNQFANDLSLPRLEGGISDLRRIERVAIFARKAHRLATEFDTKLSKKAEFVFCSIPSKALMGDSAELNSIRNQLLRHLTKAELSKAATELSTLHEKLAGKTGAVSIDIKQFVEKQLGNPTIPSDRIAAYYTELIAELKRITSLTVELALIKDFAARIEQAGAPKLALRICSQPVEITGEDAVC